MEKQIPTEQNYEENYEGLFHKENDLNRRLGVIKDTVPALLFWNIFKIIEKNPEFNFKRPLSNEFDGNSWPMQCFIDVDPRLDCDGRRVGRATISFQGATGGDLAKDIENLEQFLNKLLEGSQNGPRGQIETLARKFKDCELQALAKDQENRGKINKLENEHARREKSNEKTSNLIQDGILLGDKKYQNESKPKICECPNAKGLSVKIPCKCNGAKVITENKSIKTLSSNNNSINIGNVDSKEIDEARRDISKTCKELLELDSANQQLKLTVGMLTKEITELHQTLKIQKENCGDIIRCHFRDIQSTSNELKTLPLKQNKSNNDSSSDKSNLNNIFEGLCDYTPKEIVSTINKPKFDTKLRPNVSVEALKEVRADIKENLGRTVNQLIIKGVSEIEKTISGKDDNINDHRKYRQHTEDFDKRNSNHDLSTIQPNTCVDALHCDKRDKKKNVKSKRINKHKVVVVVSPRQKHKIQKLDDFELAKLTTPNISDAESGPMLKPSTTPKVDKISSSKATISAKRDEHNFKGYDNTKRKLATMIVKPGALENSEICPAHRKLFCLCKKGAINTMVSAVTDCRLGNANSQTDIHSSVYCKTEIGNAKNAKSEIEGNSSNNKLNLYNKSYTEDITDDDGLGSNLRGSGKKRSKAEDMITDKSKDMKTDDKKRNCIVVSKFTSIPGPCDLGSCSKCPQDPRYYSRDNY